MNANGLPYGIPIHPNLVHLTLGLFIIAIVFDIVGTLFPLERPIFKFLTLTAVREGFFEVGWYNLLAAAIVTFFTVAAGFFELMLADSSSRLKSTWGLDIRTTLLIHGFGGIVLLAAIVGMAVWRGLQRYRWRKEEPREVQWSYLAIGIALMGVLYLHGTLGAHLGEQFGVHNTAAHLLQQGQNPNQVLRQP
jgi:uncharacterized membrane protein